MLKHVSLVAVLFFTAVPAFAENTPTDTGSQPLDPNRKICERVELTGSRVKAKKICMTAAQWEAQRAEHRDSVERAQRNTDMPKSN